MGNCFKKICAQDYNYDILDREVSDTSQSIQTVPTIIAIPELPPSMPFVSSTSTVYNSVQSDLSESFKESLSKADTLLKV